VVSQTKVDAVDQISVPAIEASPMQTLVMSFALLFNKHASFVQSSQSGSDKDSRLQGCHVMSCRLVCGL